MKNSILKIENLTKYYGKVLGVKNLSLELEQGEVFGFIGPNGAGKSTTLRSIMNLINKTEGKVYVDGQEFTKNSIELKKYIGYLPSEIHLYDDLTVGKMLDYHESYYRIDSKERRNELVKRLNLNESKKIEDLSLGNLKKLGIILALIHNPKILILDEPTSGLDPIMQQEFFEILKEEKVKGTTILYSTHILNEVSKICDRIGIIKEGTLIKVEKIEDIKNSVSKKVIKITSNEIDEIINELNIEIITRENNSIKFKNNLEIDEMLKKLSKFKILDLLIEEESMEEVLLNYYK